MIYQNKNNPNSFIYIESLTPNYGILDCVWLSFNGEKWASWSSFTWLEELEAKFIKVN